MPGMTTLYNGIYMFHVPMTVRSKGIFNVYINDIELMECLVYWRDNERDFGGAVISSLISNS